MDINNNIPEQCVNDLINRVVKNFVSNQNDDSLDILVVEEDKLEVGEPVVYKQNPVNEDLKKKVTLLEKLVDNLIKKEMIVNNPIIESIEQTPEIIFIVPYRDRKPQRYAFIKIMTHILEDLNCKVLFVHQRDKRPFNRGAMKNLGFIHVKKMYPNKYKDITLVFHDIDNIPWYKGQFSYTTQRNTINHFYGYPRALGGIFAIKAWDFEHINGFPNIWTWGLEDNMLLRRAEQYNKKVIRPEFVHLEKNNNNIIGLWHGWDRLVNPHIEHKGRADRGQDGIRSLYHLEINYKKIDNLFIEVNITAFQTGENLKSPFVRGAKQTDTRTIPRLNKPFYIKKKRGTSGTFGKKNGYGSMAF